MLYGNGLSSDFIGSGYSIPWDRSYVGTGKPSGAFLNYKLPIMASSAGLHYPTNLENSLFAVKTGVYEKTSAGLKEYLYDYSNAIDETMLRTIDSSDTTTYLGSFTGSYMENHKPHQALYLCQNWWKFATYKNDDITHMFNYSAANGGYSDIHISAWKGLKGYKRVFPNKNVSCSIDMGDLSRVNVTSNTKGMPGYMGAAIIFDTTSDFNGSKYIGIGFKGLKTNSLTGDSWDFYHKLYKFTSADGYFKKINDRTYLFNDPEIVNVKGINASLPNNSYFYSGPCFIKGKYEVGTYSDAAQTQKVKHLNIDIPDFIYAPNIESSVSYLTVNDNFEDFISAKPSNATIGIGNYSAGCHSKIWSNSNGVYFESKPYGPGIPFAFYDSYPLYIGTLATEVYFGKSLECFSQIAKTYTTSAGEPSSLINLTAVNGTWKHGINLTYTPSLFYDASALKTIPSSWEGLNKLQYIPSMFNNCYSLTAIPSSWNGLTCAYYAPSMFSNCYSLTAIPSSWDGLDSANVNFDGSSMFSNCSALKNVPPAAEWDKFIKRIKQNGSTLNIPGMFNNCIGITGTVKELLDVFKANNVQGAGQFGHCSGFSDYFTYRNNSEYSAYL